MNKRIVISIITLCICLASPLSTKIAFAANKSDYRLVYEESRDFDGTTKYFYTYDKETGNLMSVRRLDEDEDSLVEYSYDEEGREIKHTFHYKDGRTYKYETEYETKGNTKIKRDYDIDNATGNRSLDSIDKATYSKGRLIRQKSYDYYGDSTPSLNLTKYKYDKKGNLEKELYYIRENGKWVLQNSEKNTYEKVDGKFCRTKSITKRKWFKGFVYHDHYRYNSHGDIEQVTTKKYQNGKYRPDLDETYYYKNKYDHAGNLIRTRVIKKGNRVYNYVHIYKWEKYRQGNTC